MTKHHEECLTRNQACKLQFQILCKSSETQSLKISDTFSSSFQDVREEERDQEATDSTVRRDSTCLMGGECASLCVFSALLFCACKRACTCMFIIAVFYCSTDEPCWKLMRNTENKFSTNRQQLLTPSRCWL